MQQAAQYIKYKIRRVHRRLVDIETVCSLAFLFGMLCSTPNLGRFISHPLTSMLDGTLFGSLYSLVAAVVYGNLPPNFHFLLSMALILSIIELFKNTGF